MKRYAPVLTLVAVAVLGAALLLLNSVSNPANRPAPVAAPAAAAAPAPAVGPAPGATVVDLAELAPAPPADPVGPADPPPVVEEKAYAGRSSGNEVTVAIAVKGERAVAYVCNGKKIEAWLEGTLTGDRLALSSAKGSTITGTLDDAAALGTVTVGAKQWPFAAKGVQAPAGLYEGRADVRGVATRIGWIVEGDGSVTGAATVAGSPEPRSAPPFDPAAPGATTYQGTPVVVTAVGGDFAAVQR